MKIVSGHQPVYLPWLGLFHKLQLCDVFVYMDTVQYLHQDWNNRNKIRTPHGSFLLTVPIDKNKSKGQNLDEIVIKSGDPSSKNFWQNQHFINIQSNYKKAPFYSVYVEDLEYMYMNTIWEKLVDLCWAQFELIRRWLGLGDIEVVRMSEHKFHGYKDELVLDHCLQLSGDCVVFGAHGQDYVNIEKFHSKGIRIYFQDYQHPVYRQRFEPFEPFLSVIDLLFNHGPKSLEILLSDNVGIEDLKTNDKYWI